MATGKVNGVRSPLCCFTLCLILMASACDGGSDDTSQPPNQSAKVFALMEIGDSESVLDNFAAQEMVDGLAYRTSWRVLEPQDGVFNWTTLDAAFDIVRAYGMQLTLHVGVSSVGLPSWLAALDVVMYTYQPPMAVEVAEPVPWDASIFHATRN